MVEIIEESFGLPGDGWMVSFHHQRTQPPVMKQRVLTPRQRIFLDLLDELPESEADNLLKLLKRKTVLQYDLRRNP